MHDARRDRRIGAAYVAVLFMTLIVALAFLLKRYDIDLAVTYAIIVVAPLLIYLILSGDVSEVAGLGGFSAKFKDDARAPVDTNAEIEEPQFVLKARVAMLTRQMPRYKPGKPIALTFRLGDPRSGYTRAAIESYITSLIGLDPHLTVILIDNAAREFVASVDGARMFMVIRDNRMGNDLVKAIDANDLPGIRNLMNLTTRSISKAETNAGALRIMLEDDVASLVSVDDARRPSGVVRRDRIMARLVVSLAA